MGDRTVPLGIQCESQIPKLRTRTNCGNLGAGIHGHLVEQLEINHKMSILSTNAVRGIIMTPGSSVDLHAMLPSTSDCGLYLRDGTRDRDGEGREAQTDVVGAG